MTSFRGRDWLGRATAGSSPAVNADDAEDADDAGTDTGAGSESLLWSLLDAVPDGLLVVDRDGRIVLANRRAGELFGDDPEGLVGLRIEELIPEPLRQSHQIHRASYVAAPRTRPMGFYDVAGFIAQRRDHSTFLADISLSPLAGEDELVLAAVRDATRERATADRLRQAEEREQLARDLHDVVIQRLFAAGGWLFALGNALGEQPAEAARLQQAMELLESTIDEIRDRVFAEPGPLAEHQSGGPGPTLGGSTQHGPASPRGGPGGAGGLR